MTEDIEEKQSQRTIQITHKNITLLVLQNFYIIYLLFIIHKNIYII